MEIIHLEIAAHSALHFHVGQLGQAPERESGKMQLRRCVPRQGLIGTPQPSRKLAFGADDPVEESRAVRIDGENHFGLTAIVASVDCPVERRHPLHRRRNKPLVSTAKWTVGA